MATTTTATTAAPVKRSRSLTAINAGSTPTGKAKAQTMETKNPGTTHKHPAAFRSVQGSATRETTTVKKKIAMV